VWLLRLKLYHVLARNFRPLKGAGLGEVDIIARKGHTLVFVEVKARADETAAINAISAEQQTRVMRAAAHFVKQNPVYAACAMRYDAMLHEVGRFWPRHVIDAWRT
jgi:putative endonuclease